MDIWLAYKIRGNDIVSFHGKWWYGYIHGRITLISYAEYRQMILHGGVKMILFSLDWAAVLKIIKEKALGRG